MKRNRFLVLQTAALLAGSLSVGVVPPVFAGDQALGEYLSAECVSCHQTSGQFSGIPSIVGWPEESFVQVIREYRQKARANEIMRTIAGRLSDEEVAALATYFGRLKEQKRSQ